MVKMKFFSFNKRGTDKMIALYWFFILFLVAAAVVYMAAVFYGYPLDVREAEAEILINKVADCIYSNGKLNPNLYINNQFVLEFKDNFKTECTLNFNEDQIYEGVEQYYVGVSFYDVSDKETLIYYIGEGNNNYLGACEIQNDDYEKLAICMKKRFYVSAESKQYLVEITGVVNKGKQNAK